VTATEFATVLGDHTGPAVSTTEHVLAALYALGVDNAFCSRGTGCSGGVWDFFQPAEARDGVDVIRWIAAQPWSDGKVAMIGKSYPGITQLFVAKTQPPHLSAITPLSVLDDTYDTLYPGGIFNNGFALGWARDREADARPATRAGQGQEWARKRIADGDETCRDNQALRLQSANVTKAVAANAFLRGAASDAIAPESFVHDINVPVFLAGAWQDQETGSHFANMLGNFSSDIPMKITLMNGLHQDSLGPAVLSQWIEFLDFYVARKIPSIPATTRAIATAALGRIFGRGATLAPDRFTDQPDYASALRTYEAEPKVRVLHSESFFSWVRICVLPLANTSVSSCENRSRSWRILVPSSSSSSQ